MAGILIAWAFASFLFFKIAFDWFFHASISIVASLLLAVLMAISVFAASYVYAMRLLRYNWTPGAVPAHFGELLAKTILPFVGFSVAQMLVSRAVIFGFSKELNREIRVFSSYWNKNIDESIIYFAGIVVLPLFAHYLISLIGTYNSADRNSQ